MPTRRLYVSGTSGVMLIGTDDIYIGGLAGNPAVFTEGGAITSPLNYRDKLYFHSNLPYVQIKQKVSPGDLSFAAQNRGTISWSDGGKGCDFGCFITTAAVNYAGESDDCYTLSVLRKFRDEFMHTDPKLKELVEEYYNTAPQIVAAVEGLENAEELYKQVYNKYLVPAVQAIEAGNNEMALDIYTKMYNYVKESAGL